jgi:alpha-beta hydrolase superfamily lysophospholipase
VTADHLRLEIDVTAAVPALGEPARIVADLIVPPAPCALLVCICGGGMHRLYFDLATPPGEPVASFAQAMAARGFAVAWLDPLGVGESTVPEDPYLLTPELMAAANGAAARFILEGLSAGDLSAEWPAWPGLKSIGVGHSYGALLTVVQEAEAPMHAGVAAFGFHTAGLPELATPAELAKPPRQVRADLVAMTREKHPIPYVDLKPGPSRQAVSAVPAFQKLLVTMTLMSRLPDMVAQEAAALTAPLFLAFGDNDLVADTHAAVAAYPSCPDITLVVLPQTRHNHFIYPSRTRLFERFARWADGVLARR